MAPDFALRFGVIVHAPQIIATEHRGERAVERKDFQSMAGEIELANNFWAKERDHIGTFRKEKAGNDFLGDRRATKNSAPLKHQEPSSPLSPDRLRSPDHCGRRR